MNPARIGYTFAPRAKAITLPRCARSQEVGLSRVFRQIACAGLAAVSLPLLASDSGIQTGLIPLSTPDLPTVTAPDEVAQPQPLPDIPGLEIEIVGFIYEGVTLFEPIEFDRLNKELVFGRATIGELRSAADRIAALYRENGYLANVFLPRQDVTQGIVNFRVVEARFGSVAESQASLVTKPFIEKALTKGDLLSLEELDRALLLAGDIPTFSVVGRLIEGGEIGSTNLLLLETQLPSQASVSISNFGSRSTGSVRSTLNWKGTAPGASLTQLELQSVHSQGINQFTAGLRWPIGFSGLTGGLQISSLNYQVVAGEQKSLDPKGTSSSAAFDLRYPVVRSKSRNLFLNLRGEQTAFTNKANGSITSDYDVQNLELGLSGNQYLSWLNGTTSLEYSGGLTLGRSNRNQTDDGYWIAKARARAVHQWGSTNELLLRWRAQQTDQTLDSSQRISLGGPVAVRAFPVGEGAGDDVYLLSVEFSKAVGALTRIGLFYDWGLTWSRDSADYELDGAGLSFKTTLAPSISVVAEIARQIGAHPSPSLQGRNQDGSSSKTQYWVRLNYDH